MTETAPALLIRSEQDAWDVLARIATGEFRISDFPGGIQFVGWTAELLRVNDKVHSSITTSMMKLFLDYQALINKTYKTAKYGELSSRKLNSSEKSELELRIIVSSGSSVYNSDPKEAVGVAIREAIAKMDSKHIAITSVAVALILAVGYFGADAFKAYMSAQSAEAGVRERVLLSEQETRRAQILVQLATQNPQLREAVRQSEEGHRTLLKGALISGGARIHGTDVSADSAADLLAPSRRTGAGATLDGEYEVTEITRQENGTFWVDVRSPIDGAAITAEASEFLTPQDHIDRLFGALRQSHKRVFIRMNAWQVGGEVTRATIVRVEDSPPSP